MVAAGPALHRRRGARHVADRRRRHQSRRPGRGRRRQPARGAAQGRHRERRRPAAPFKTRRTLPVRFTQGLQLIMQNRIISPALAGTQRPKPPLLFKLVGRDCRAAPHPGPSPRPSGCGRSTSTRPTCSPRSLNLLRIRAGLSRASSRRRLEWPATCHLQFCGIEAICRINRRIVAGDSRHDRRPRRTNRRAAHSRPMSPSCCS